MSILSNAMVGLLLAVPANQPVAPTEAPRPAESVRLEYHFEEGDILRMEVKEISRLLVAKGEARQEQSNRSTTENRYVVTDVAEAGQATLKCRIVAARMRGQFDNDPPIEFDSRKDETPAGFEQIRKAIGVDRLELVVKPDGTLVEVRSLLEETAGGQLDDTDEETTKPNVFPPLPRNPVTVGDEWSRVRTVRVSVGDGLNSPLTQEVRILHSYRLESIEEGVATIRTESNPLTGINNPAIQVQVAPQKSTGTIRFDIKRGLVLEQTKTVDNLTIGWQGPDSSLKTLRTRTERLLSLSGDEGSGDREISKR